MEFRLLGAVSVATEAGELPLGPAKRRSVLAALLLRPNTAVPVDQLIDTIWDETPPAHARTVVQGHVSRLRALLNDGEAAAYGVELATRGSAYVLQTSESLLDAHRFEELVHLARRQRKPADAVLMLREALALWRGPALTGTVTSEPLRAAAHALEETRLVTVENLAEAYGKLGEHGRAAAVLRTEAVAHPMRESLAAALMQALYRAGRQSDALDWYHRTRRLLSDELGVDPGRALQDAYRAILQGDGQGDRDARGAGTSGAGGTAGSGIAGGAGPGADVTGGTGSTGRTGSTGGTSATDGTGSTGGTSATDGTGPSWGVESDGIAPDVPSHTRTHRRSSRPPLTTTAPEASDVPRPTHASQESHGVSERPRPAHGSAFRPQAGSDAPSCSAASTGDEELPPDPPRTGASRTGSASAPETEPSAAAAGGATGPMSAPGAAPGAGASSASVPSAASSRPPREPSRSAPPAPPRDQWASTPAPTGAAAHVPEPGFLSRSPYTVPELLPRRPRGFLGRRDELDAVGEAAAWGEAPVVLVTGPAGVGKTALALHWAYRAAAAFPDGRLYADLHGFDALANPEPVDVVREFLVSLGVTGRAVPETPAAAAALYRRLTEDRRLLVVLDNAHSSEQVRPLLPSGGDCVTVVTSRNRLDGLIAADLARPVPLSVLGPEDATALLAGVIGPRRAAAEPEAASRLAELCDGLPLALRITAARLATHPERTLHQHAAELADEQSRLAMLEVEDRGVEAELRLSVQKLRPADRRTFLNLGAHTGRTFDRYAAGALARSTPGEAGAALDRLAAAHLVQEAGPGRYALHDLVRLYARALAEAEAETETATGTSTETGSGTRGNATLRLIDHYLHTALAANAVAEPGSRPCCTIPDDAPKTHPVQKFGSRAEVIEWYAAEREALAGAMTAAESADCPERVWRLGVLQWPYVLWRVRDGWTPMLEQTLRATVAVADPDAESRVRALLGWVLLEEGKPEEAYPHLELAPELAGRAGNPVDEAIGRINLSLAQQSRGEAAEARRACVRAAELARQAGDRQTEMLALQTLAEHCLRAGEPEAALRHSLDGLALDPADLGLLRRVLLQTAHGESLAQLGRMAEGVELLSLAAETAEQEGFHEGACRALSALLRLTGDSAAYGDRHARASAALTTGR
ncbi:AfsR/SARP family transcriptional regulator [Streptomyces sp. CA-294286]|uniref:AfsR/SARP family transcriptional regulator n=1 Tax=Streptomyces sp. CA-294286 TaxID=3240070 RepID=UPI003D9134F5